MAASTKKAIFVVGPTASGKSAWALEQAVRYGGSVVNVDSVQLYQGLEVGSAAPTAAEKEQAPHHLYSYVQAPRELTAGQYVDEFYRLLEKSDLQFPLFIVGGTGFYIQALEKGLFDIAPTAPGIRESLEAELKLDGAENLYAELKAKDPASPIHVNDHYRLVRALEIIRATGKRPTELKLENSFKKSVFPFPFTKVGFQLEKPEFLKRVQRRTEIMVSSGLIEETRRLMEKGFAGWTPLSSVGYRETQQFLLEGKTNDWLREQVIQSTMQLIKKQKTWFRRDPEIRWSDQSQHIGEFLK